MENNEKCIIDPKRDCIGIAEAALLKKRIEDLETWRDNSEKFHEDFHQYQLEQIARDTKIDTKLSTMSDNVDKILKWQEEQQLKPAKKWDSVVDKVLMMIVGGGVGYILTQIGLQ